MAKRTKTTTIIREAPDEDERPEQITRVVDEDTTKQTYSAFVNRLRGSQGAMVKVYRQTPRGRQFCFQDLPENIESEETIRRYHADQPYAHEDGEYVVYVTINGELQEPFKMYIAPQIKSNVGVAVASGGMAVSSEVRMLQDQLNRLEARLSAPVPQEKPPILDMIEGMAKLDAMRGGANGGQMGVDNILKCIEIGSRMSGGGAAAGSDSWEGMLRDVARENAPALISLFQGFMKKPEAAQVQPAPAPQPTEEQPPPTTEELTLKMKEEEKMILQQVLGFLKHKAASGSDPSLYANLLIDDSQNPMYAKLISEIVDNEFSAFAAIDPDIAKPEYRDFFGAIHDRIRRVFKRADTVATTGGGKDGNKKNASSNGATGKSGGE